MLNSITTKTLNNTVDLLVKFCNCFLAHLKILLLLSRFSRIRLCATPQTAAHQAPHPWDSPGKNTGVGCHFLLQCMKVKSESEVDQLYPTPSDPMDCSLPGPSIHGIFQARVLEWVAIAFSVLRYQWAANLKKYIYPLKNGGSKAKDRFGSRLNSFFPKLNNAIVQKNISSLPCLSKVEKIIHIPLTTSM